MSAYTPDDAKKVTPTSAGQDAPFASKHGIRTRLLIFLVFSDIVVITAGFLGALWFRFGDGAYNKSPNIVAFVLLFYLLAAIQQSAFRPSIYIHSTRSTRRAAFAFVSAVLFSISFTFFLKISIDISRVFTIAGGLLSGLFLIISRHVFARIAHGALNGSPESEVVLIDGIQPPVDCTAFKVDVQALAIRPDIHDPAALDHLGRIIHEADRVIVACVPERRADWSLALKGAGVDAEVLAPELDAIGAIHTRRYYGTATALIASGPLNAVDRLLKRAFDLALAIPALVLLAPVLIAIAILIRIDSPGPALFIQHRIGKGNRMFPMYKFRSMYTGQADRTASKLTTRNDARVTRIGRFLRKTSLDEVPQLLNILRGDMSIVGPRPHATGALAGDALYWEVTSQYWSRHAVKPGLTGLAQVRGFRGNTETGDDLLNRLQADLAYLDSWSVWRDVVLVLQTFRVIMHRNAF